MRRSTIFLVTSCLWALAACTRTVVYQPAPDRQPRDSRPPPRTPPGPDNPPPVNDRPNRPDRTYEVLIPPGHLPNPGECRIWIPNTPPGRQPRPRSRICAGIEAIAPPGSWIVYRRSDDNRLVYIRLIDDRRAGIVVRNRIFDMNTWEMLRDEDMRDANRDPNDRPREPRERPREPQERPRDSTPPPVVQPPGNRPPDVKPPERPPEQRPPEQRPPVPPPAIQPPIERPPAQQPPENKPPEQRPPVPPPAIQPPIERPPENKPPEQRPPPDNKPPVQPPPVQPPPNQPPPNQPPPVPNITLDVPPGHLPELGECRVWIPGLPPGQEPRPKSRICDGILGAAPAGSWILYRPSDDRTVIHVRMIDERRAGVVVKIRIFDYDSKRLLREVNP